MIYGFIIYWQSACSTSATRLNVFAKQRASFFNSACADTLFWLRLDTASAARWMSFLTRLRMSLLFWLLLCCDISSCDNGVGVSFIFIFDICDICVNGRPSCDVCGCDNGVGVSFIFIFDICDICFNGKPSCDVGCITSSQNLFSSCDENVCSCDNSLKSCDNVCSWENIISARSLRVCAVVEKFGQTLPYFLQTSWRGCPPCLAGCTCKHVGYMQITILCRFAKTLCRWG